MSRAECAWRWVRQFAPEDFKFKLKEEGTPAHALSPEATHAVRGLLAIIEGEMDHLDEKALNDKIYAVAGEAGLDTKEFYKVMYQALVGKDQGPRLASFLKIIGREKLLGILASYR